MSLVPSLLQAIVSVDGEALVMHASEKPYVVAPSGHVDLARAPLTTDSVSNIVAELLPPDLQQALEDQGAVQFNLPSQLDFPREQFTIIAARGGDDVWVEIRRRRVPDEDQAPGKFVPQPPGPGASAFGQDPIPPMVPEPTVPVSALSDESRATSAPGEGPVAAENGAEDDEEDADLSGLTVHRMSTPAVVLPMTRSSMVQDAGPSRRLDGPGPLERLLRIAASRSASMLYLSAGARPAVRLDGALHILDDESPTTAADVLSLLSACGFREGGVSDVAHVGRIRCMPFHDFQGPGAVISLMSAVPSAEQAALPPDIRSLALEPEGLVLVAGGRASGKRTLMAALVDLINRLRHDHVVTLERHVTALHSHLNSFVSQREVIDDADAARAAVAALAEDPDVLVIEEITTTELRRIACDAASRCLVIAGVAAPSTAEAIRRVTSMIGVDEEERHVCGVIAERLRGVITQVLAARSGGGRVAVREVLMNRPAVAQLIADGRAGELALTGEASRHGLVSLNDVLAGYVRDGIVEAGEAYRHAPDRAAFLVRLATHGVDTSGLERRA